MTKKDMTSLDMIRKCHPKHTRKSMSYSAPDTLEAWKDLIDELLLKKELSPEIEIQGTDDSWGGGVPHLIVYLKETDEEYEARLLDLQKNYIEQKIERKERAAAARKKKEKRDRELYEKLKKKYG